MARGSAGADTVTTVVATGRGETPDRGPAATSDTNGTRTTTAATSATANQARTRYPITRGRPGCATGDRGSLPPVITIRRPAPGPPPGDASGRGPGQVDPTGRRSAASAPRSAAPPPNGLEERPHRSADRSQRAPGRRPTNDLSRRHIRRTLRRPPVGIRRGGATTGRPDVEPAARQGRTGPRQHRRGVKLPDKSDHATHWGDGATQPFPRTPFTARGRDRCRPSRGSTLPAVNPQLPVASGNTHRST